MFAFRDGIIDAASINGGITYDAHGAYAIVLRSDEEINAPTPHSFTYRCKQNDPGIWRLTMPQPREKTRVRVLRSHALSSLWAPVAGIRYDGVYVCLLHPTRPFTSLLTASERQIQSHWPHLAPHHPQRPLHQPANLQVPRPPRAHRQNSHWRHPLPPARRRARRLSRL
jgi:hypothetical protein